MRLAEYGDHDGLGLAELVKRGDVTAAELVEEAIARTEELNPKLNAVVFKGYDLAREWAKEHDSSGASAPLKGVPMLLKDILAFCPGFPTTSGSNYMPAVPLPLESEIVARYRRAGLIPLGKTNAPEFGLVCTTEPVRYGATHNPWDLERTPGGSSGGSAAAVAARIVPIAHANDGGGSIRIPAACCGLVGLKPTRARNSLGPIIGDAMSGLVAEHVVTRSVRDCAAVLDATAGMIPGDPYTAPPAPESFLTEVTAPGQVMRIAIMPEEPGAPRDPACEQALQDTVQLLGELGHIVEEPPRFNPQSVSAESGEFTAIWCAGLASNLAALEPLLGKPPSRDDLEALTWAMNEAGKKVSAVEYLSAVAKMQSLSREFAQHYREYDLTLVPTLNKPPLKLGEIDVRSSDLDAQMEIMFRFIPHTGLFNMTGCPAITLPLAWTNADLPLGMMFGARFGDEASLFRIAGQLERARPWANKVPPVV
jgi:amidase